MIIPKVPIINNSFTIPLDWYVTAISDRNQINLAVGLTIDALSTLHHELVNTYPVKPIRHRERASMYDTLRKVFLERLLSTGRTMSDVVNITMTDTPTQITYVLKPAV